MSLLLNERYEAIILDNLVRGNKESIPEGERFIKGDLFNKVLLDSIFKRDKIDSVIHFAAYAYVGKYGRIS
jgi:UDP-glucose 4-epimerase